VVIIHQSYNQNKKGEWYMNWNTRELVQHLLLGGIFLVCLLGMFFGLIYYGSNDHTPTQEKDAPKIERLSNDTEFEGHCYYWVKVDTVLGLMEKESGIITLVPSGI